MQFSEYQKEAQSTDRIKTNESDQDYLTYPLFGLTGESGNLLGMHKKYLRDGKDSLPKDWLVSVTEELGDILWYTTDLASRLELSIEKIVQENIQRIYSSKPDLNDNNKELHTFVEFAQYQELAFRTKENDDLSEYLMRLIGEVGSLIYYHNKFTKKKEIPKEEYLSKCKELIGNIFWYLATISKMLNINFEKLPERNLQKVKEMWSEQYAVSSLLDDNYDDDEQFPRKFTIHFSSKNLTNSEKLNQGAYVKISINDIFIGDRLTDNAYDDDGYRFHDILHFGHVAVLGWSPVVRALLKRKRKSSPKIDEVEDGLRAQIIEELVAALNYNYAKKYNFLKKHKRVDNNHIKYIQSLIAQLEVKQSTHFQWQKCILDSFKVFNQLREHNGGYVNIDLIKREITFSQVVKNET